MKTTKKFLATVIAVASVMAIAPMSAFADDTVINQNSTGNTGGMVVSYTKSQVSPTFTITIPATVDLNSSTRTATITAEDVYLDTTQHKQINVTLDSADYVNTGDTTFKAKNANLDSEVTYTIGKGTATTGIAVGDTVAEFTEDGSQVLSFSEPTGATYAGTHTETLTFGIAVEDVPQITTKTWNTSVISSINLTNINQSFINDDITVTFKVNGNSGCYFKEKKIQSGWAETLTLEFSSDAGKIKSITITGDIGNWNSGLGAGWSNSNDKAAIWSGTPSSTVTLSGVMVDIHNISSIEFVVEE